MAVRSIFPSDDAHYTLQLAPNFQPDVNQLFRTNGLACFGIPGSGKSNVLALLCEQFALLQVPLLLLDTEGESLDLLSVFPRGVLADKDHLPDPHALLHSGQQVILNLKSWDEDYESAALVIGELVESLFRVAGAQAPFDRVPCPIIMDEAATWLPHRTKSVSHLTKETKTMLLTIFERLGARGRKYGLIPFYFTQFVSQVDPDIIRPCATRVLMKQVSPLDLKRYADYIPMTQHLKTSIQQFLPGQAIVTGLGEPLHTRFYEQLTEHPSHTPTVQAALAKFAPSGYQRPPALPVQEPISFTAFQRKQEESSDLLFCQKKVLGYIEKYQHSDDSNVRSTFRNLTRYLKSFTHEQLEQAVLELVKAGKVVETKQGKTTVYHLA